MNSNNKFYLFAVLIILLASCGHVTKKEPSAEIPEKSADEICQKL